MSSSAATKALLEAKRTVFWSDRSEAPDPTHPLVGAADADLAVIGGGFTGLWAALQALEASPGRKVMILESDLCGFGGSSRNGGFCSRSLTHGLSQGLVRWPQEVQKLVELGEENLTGIEDTLRRHSVDAAFERVGELDVATAQWQLDDLVEAAEEHRAVGDDALLLDAPQVRGLVNSPQYQGGLLVRNGLALVDPARLVWGLRAAVLALGGVIHERTPVLGVESTASGLAIRTSTGSVAAEKAVMATNAYGRPLKRVRRHMIPVYDHVLMTEPLSDAQMRTLGWNGREGIGDAANQFHYYRLSQDNRILWGGYDATYHFNNGVDPKFDQSDNVHGRLADHFFDAFPQLEDVRFTHRWGGPIATTSRFTATWGTAKSGKLAWVMGYTGLGVGASRFGAKVALDLVDGVQSELTELEMVRRKPIPFPPEPLRSAVIGVTKRAIQNADANEGKRGPWLHALDRFGIGFDS